MENPLKSYEKSWFGGSWGLHEGPWGGSWGHLGSKRQRSGEQVIRWTPPGRPSWTPNSVEIVMLALLRTIVSIKVTVEGVFLRVLVFYLFFEGLKDAKSVILRGSNLQKVTTVQCF